MQATAFDLHQRGLSCIHRHEYPQAVEYTIQAIEQDPQNADLFNTLGYAMLMLQQFDAAIECFDQSIALNPGLPDPHLNKGNALHKTHRHELAIAQFNRALELRPNYVEAYSNRGNAQLALRQIADALASFDAALELNPCSPALLNHQGTAYKHQGDMVAALASYDAALAIEPGFVNALVNRANALLDFGHKDQALTAYDQAIATAPTNADAQYNRGLCLLQMGRLTEGWQGYEWRWQKQDAKTPYLVTSKPVLPLHGKTQRLLIWSEQGIGDEIMFASLFKLARQLAYKILVQTDARLIPIFERSFPDFEFYPRHTTVDEDSYDHHLPIGSLCGFFLHTLDDFTLINTPFLVPSQAYDIQASGILDPHKINCGISWRSANPTVGLDKSLTLKDFVKRLPVENLNLINLQYGDVREELAQLKAETGIHVHQHPGIDNMQDLDGLSALIHACDEVVTVSNVTVHMARSIGIPFILILNNSSFWRINFLKMEKTKYHVQLFN